jgi:hypothetical protein
MPKFLASIWPIRTELCAMMNVSSHGKPFLLGAFLSAREKEKCRRSHTTKKSAHKKRHLTRKKIITITNENRTEINLKK